MNKKFAKSRLTSFIISLVIWSILYLFITPQKSIGETVFSILFTAILMTILIPLGSTLQTLMNKITGKKKEPE